MNTFGYEFLKLNDNLTYEKVFQTVLSLQIWAWKVVPILYTLIECSRSTEVANILHRIQKCDNQMSDFLVPYQIKLSYNFTNLTLITVTLRTIFSTSVAIFFDFTISKLNFGVKEVILEIVSYFLFNFTMPLFIMKFLIVNRIIWNRIKVINLVLQKHKYGKEKVSAIFLAYFYTYDYKYILCEGKSVFIWDIEKVTILEPSWRKRGIT